MAVYHLSAQFPGPTAPRDFVTLLMTSDAALVSSSSIRSLSAVTSENPKTSPFNSVPRHFMVISRPCIHPDCPPRDGYIRGQYESIEFIREIPIKPKKSLSTTELLKVRHPRGSSSLHRKSSLRELNEEDYADSASDDTQSNNLEMNASVRGRRRGRTISFAESRGISAKGEAMDANSADSDELDETNPVEWIMVTRSDPGGRVPRFLVERGTPAGIVSDASKFVDWAFKKEHLELKEGVEERKEDIRGNEVHRGKDQELEAYQTNGHLAGLNGNVRQAEPRLQAVESDDTSNSKAPEHGQGGLFASVANAAYSGLETYAPQVMTNHLPGHHAILSHAPSAVTEEIDQNNRNGVQPGRDGGDALSISSSSSVASFASAEDHFEDCPSVHSTTDSVPASTTQAKDASDMTQQEKELEKLEERRRTLDEKLAKVREKEAKDKEEMTSREGERLRKAEEKHAREVQKQEQKYKREVARLEAKRARESAKEEERRRKNEDKDEKARLSREKEQYRQQLEVVSRERDLLKEQVGALQKENTALVAKIGKVGGPDLLRDVRSELSGRNRSGSLRKMRSVATGGSSSNHSTSNSVVGFDATVLASSPAVTATDAAEEKQE